MRMRDCLGVAAAIVASIVGAGFASGREIVVFFGRYGVAGYAGAITAAGLVALAVRGVVTLAARYGEGALPGLMRRVAGRSAGGNALLALLLITVSAAMVAAGGELGALLVNMHGARELGMALTALLAAACAARGMATLKWLGGLTVAVMLCYFVLLALRAPETGPAFVRPGALASAAAYAGFNIAGACGVACAAGLELGAQGDARRAAARIGCAAGSLLLALLLAALACMRAHWAQVEPAPLPSVLLAARLGISGYYITIAVMWIAVLSTLAGAVLALELQARRRGLEAWDVRAGALGVATLLGGVGFGRLVDGAYPVLGGLCALYLAALLALGRGEWWPRRAGRSRS